jgi:hypothetical protein
VDITPVGMLSREALTEEKPRFEIIMPLKVVSPPFGILIAICLVSAYSRMVILTAYIK